MSKSINFLKRIKSILPINKKVDDTTPYFTLSISDNLNNILTELISDSNYVLGIHKSGLANPEDIIKEGLRLTGHASSGVVDKEVHLEHNINFYTATVSDLIRDIITASSYKTYGLNKGNAIIIRIPKTDIDRLDKLLKPESRILKPEYITGYIPVSYDSDNRLVTIGDMVYSQNDIKHL